MAVSVKSASRVLSIFEYFERTRAPRTLSEISQDLEYPVSSTLALLRSVKRMGYLNYNEETKAYSPGIRFALLGQWIYDRLFQEGALIQMMEHLVGVTQETASLGIQNGLQSQHVHIIETPQLLRYVPAVGTLRPLLRSAVGRVILSQQPKAEILKIVERINALGVDEGRVFDPQDILKDLGQVRRKGFAYSASVFTPGVGIISVALPQHEGEVPMAISISGPSSRINQQTLPTVFEEIHRAIEKFRPPATD